VAPGPHAVTSDRAAHAEWRSPSSPTPRYDRPRPAHCVRTRRRCSRSSPPKIRAAQATGDARADIDPATAAARAAGPAPPRRLADLTDREREVVALVGAGLSNDEIAVRLVVSPATAKTHVSRAMVKLGARDRAQLVVFAYEAGLVRPGWLP
jgi:DNA-binding NarL/FixJ family response regulator